MASALKWGLADCDDIGVDADKRTLTPADLAKVLDLVKLRPIQFCLFLKALVGVEEMQRIMVRAIGVAKQQDWPDRHNSRGILKSEPSSWST